MLMILSRRNFSFTNHLVLPHCLPTGGSSEVNQLAKEIMNYQPVSYLPYDVTTRSRDLYAGFRSVRLVLSHASTFSLLPRMDWHEPRGHRDSARSRVSRPTDQIVNH